MINNSIPLSSYALVAIQLLKGPVYTEDTKVWYELQAYKTELLEYFGKIGLVLAITEEDGFARLVQPGGASDEEYDNDDGLPRLMRKVTLNYDTSLLCVIIREMLEESDVRSEASKLFITQKDIKERIELFYKNQTNMSKLWKELSKPINALVRIGILKQVREDSVNEDLNQYEVKRIIRALIDNEKLEEISSKMRGLRTDLPQEETNQN